MLVRSKQIPNWPDNYISYISKFEFTRILIHLSIVHKLKLSECLGIQDDKNWAKSSL